MIPLALLHQRETRGRLSIGEPVGRAPFPIAAHPRGNRSRRPLRPSLSATCRRLHPFPSFASRSLSGAEVPSLGDSSLHLPGRFGVRAFSA